jgi:beta-lactamase regulating signal transducer with metallopeptidase domain
MTRGSANWELLTNTWSERWAWTLLHSLWQDGLLMMGLWIVLRLLPARRAEGRHRAALAAFGLAALAPLATWAWLADNSVGTARTPAVFVQTVGAPPATSTVPDGESSGSANTPLNDPVLPTSPAVVAKEASRSHRRVISILLTIWIAGVVIQLLRTVRDLSATRALLHGESVVPSSLEAHLARVVGLLHIRRRFAVVVRATGAAPFVFGLWKPTLVLPAALMTGLTPDQLEAVLLHELAHLRRYDDVVNFVQLVVEAILFFNPGLRWISDALRRERESSCDARAVACLSSPLPLAEALARVAEGWSGAVPAPALGFANDSDSGALLDRVRRILSPDRRPQLRMSWIALVGTMLVAGVLVCALQQAAVWSVEIAKKLLTPTERIAAVARLQGEVEPQNLGDPDAKFVVSGTIRAEKGGILPDRGLLYSLSRRVSGGGSSSSMASHGTTGSNFKVSLPPGQCWLTYFTEGYAPALVGPFRGVGGDKQDDIEIVLKHGVSGRVRVVDRKGQPIAKANVVAIPDWGVGAIFGPSVATLTDENGFWSSEHLADVPYRVTAQAAGFTPYEPSGSSRLTKDPPVIVLDAEKPATGIVVDGDGKPVAGASLRVVSEKRGNSSFYHGDQGQVLAETNTEGKFKLGGLAFDTDYSVLIDAGDRGQTVRSPVRAGADLARIVLQQKLVLGGEIRGDFSQLAADGTATIDCQSIADGIVWRHKSAKLDADGRFRFDTLLAGRYQLSLGPHTISGKIDQSITDLVVDLQELEKTSGARAVEVRFTDEDVPVKPAGSVIAQMEVLDARGRPRFGGPLPIVEGVVRLRMKTPGTLRLTAVGCQGYWFADVDTAVSAGSDPFQVRVPVLPAGAIRVKLVLPEERARDYGPTMGSAQFHVDSPAGMRRVSISGTSVSPTEIVLAPVPLDVACLVSATQGFRIEYAPIVSLDGADPVRDVTLHLPKAIDAVVRVESAEGQPLPKIPIEVNFEPTARPPGTAPGDPSPGSNIWSGDRQTDRNGQTILAGMPRNGDGYSLVARPKRDWQFARTDVRTDGEVTVLKLERGHVIEGQVVDKKTGRPVSDIEVRARPVTRSLGGFREYVAEAVTDANGNFRFSNLPEETVKLIAWGTSFPAEPEVEPGQSERVILMINVPE